MASWIVTLVSAVLGLVMGGVGMFAIALLCVKWYRISSFEGASGYFVVGLSIVGSLCGTILSLIAARVAHTNISPNWYAQPTAATALICIVLALVLIYAYSGVDRVPRIEGHGIDIIWEVRLPLPGVDEFAPKGNPREWPDEELRLELVSVVNHRPLGSSQAVFDREAFRLEDGQWILVGRVPLFTGKGEFCVNLTVGGRDDGFWPPLKPVAHAGYFQWSDWFRTNKGFKQAEDHLAIMYRFKFERQNESPTN